MANEKVGTNVIKFHAVQVMYMTVSTPEYHVRTVTPEYYVRTVTTDENLGPR